jgi:hypothetical protein
MDPDFFVVTRRPDGVLRFAGLTEQQDATPTISATYWPHKGIWTAGKHSARSLRALSEKVAPARIAGYFPNGFHLKPNKPDRMTPLIEEHCRKIGMSIRRRG